MNNIIWKCVKPLNSEDDVDKFLKQNDIKMPREIISCIKENNGGRPSPNIFTTETKKERILKAILSYNSNDKETIYVCYPSVFKDKGLFPIASDPAGNFICIDLKSNNAIVFFEHESGNKEFIANGFSEFLNNLY